MADYKIIQDPVHGSMRVHGVFLELIQTPEMQRLYGIRQLGPTYLVYPGANHTRFEHCLGAFHTAKRVCGALDIPKEDALLIKAAALMHDIGHGPYSHTLESVYDEVYRIDHGRVSSDVITGSYDIIRKEDREWLSCDRIHEILERHGLDPKEVAALVKGFLPGRRYMGQIIHGGIDVDKIDYLLRDAHYTGAVHGLIDLPRLLEVMAVHGNELVIIRKGVTSVEEMLTGRALMFISVYLHKTVRIIENMMCRCVEDVIKEIGDFQRMNDSEFMQFLLEQKGRPGELARMIKYRRLFKSAYLLPVNHTSTEIMGRLNEAGKSLKSRRGFEDGLCRKLRVPEGSLIADIPHASRMLESEAGFRLKEIKILDRGTLHQLDEYTPISEFLTGRKIPEWSLMIAAHPKCAKSLEGKIEKTVSDSL
jgi:HD superfamily phosphohydrolase